MLVQYCSPTAQVLYGVEMCGRDTLRGSSRSIAGEPKVDPFLILATRESSARLVRPDILEKDRVLQYGPAVNKLLFGPSTLIP